MICLNFGERPLSQMVKKLAIWVEMGCARHTDGDLIGNVGSIWHHSCDHFNSMLRPDCVEKQLGQDRSAWNSFANILCNTRLFFKTWIAINQMRVKVIFAKWYQANGLMMLLYLTDLERGHHILFLQFYPLYFIYFLEWLFLGFLGMVISSILPTLKNTFLSFLGIHFPCKKTSS